MLRDQPPHHPLHVVIPVKPFAEGKSRLAGALNAQERIALNRQLYAHTLARAAHFPGPAHTTVVSRSPEVLALARERGFGGLAEPPAEDGMDSLNAAVRCGTQHAIALGAQALVVMPVDLPWGHAQDLRQLVDSAAPLGPACLLVPDHHGQGTNLLYQSPVRIVDYAFGPGSLARHRQRAWQAGMTTRVLHESAFAFDIDEPADYRRWRPHSQPSARGLASAAPALRKPPQPAALPVLHQAWPAMHMR